MFDTDIYLTSQFDIRSFIYFSRRKHNYLKHMILRYVNQFYSLWSKWSFYDGVIHVLSQFECRCDFSNPSSNNLDTAIDLKIASMWLYRSSLQIFTLNHWELQNSIGTPRKNSRIKNHCNEDNYDTGEWWSLVG